MGVVAFGCGAQGDGAMSVEGAPGATGAAGAPGAKGDPGAPGAAGATGATSATDAQRAQGAQGIQGIQGIQGTQGTTGVVSTTEISAGGLAVPAGETVFGFRGPITRLTTTATQRVTVNVSALLLTGGPSSFVQADFSYGICGRPVGTPGPIFTIGNPLNTITVWPLGSVQNWTYSTSAPISGSSVLGAGTWDIGYCIENLHPTQAIVGGAMNGYIQITN